MRYNSAGDMKSPTPPESPRLARHSASPSPPQPIPIQTVGTPKRPLQMSPSSSASTPIVYHHQGNPPGIIPIAQTPDRPPRVWASGPPHHLNPHHHHFQHNLDQQHQQQARQDVQIDASLDENELIGLDLSTARIRALPLGLLNYTDFLTELRLNGNLLTSLPPQVGELRSLVALDLSDNHLSFLPPELGKLTNLVEILLYNNKLTSLPAEMGYLYQVENLGLDGNPWEEPIAGVLMTQGPLAIVEFLRDNLLGNFTLLSYNILAEKYATAQLYGYVPTWFLSWEVRKQMILHELLSYDSDIICLQEVEANQFEQYFKPQLRMRGNYDGIFSPKSRAKTMNDWDRSFVDGCAIFFKLERFRLIGQKLIEFNQLALARPSLRKHKDMYNRVMTRDNIALVARLELLDVPGPHGSELKHPEIIVGNVHIHWDPIFRDVKLVQAIMLVEEVEKIVSGSPKAGLILCGDFNSLPDSGVMQFLTNGSIGAKHPDFMEHTYEPYSTEGAKHRLGLQNAFDGLIDGGLLPLTNFTPGFCGVIDHVLFRQGPLALTGVLGGINMDYLKLLVGFPTQHQPSDHLPLMAEFRAEHGQPTTPAPPGLLHFTNNQSASHVSPPPIIPKQRRNMAKGKGQTFSLADFANMVEQKTSTTSSAWADEEVELPTAPTGAIRGTHVAQEYRPGRGPADRRATSSHAQPDLSRLPTSAPFCLYLGNLPYTATEDIVRNQLFAGYAVLDVRIPMEPGSVGRARGFGYVTVSSREEMKRALEDVHGREFGGRQVRLDIAEQQQHSGASMGDWRSASSVTGNKFEDRPGRRNDDRPGRRPDSREWRPSESPAFSQSATSDSSDWRSERPSGSAGGSAFGSRQDRSTSRDRNPSSDRPGRRHASTNATQPFITRDDFGKKL